MSVVLINKEEKHTSKTLAIKSTAHKNDYLPHSTEISVKCAEITLHVLFYHMNRMKGKTE